MDVLLVLLMMWWIFFPIYPNGIFFIIGNPPWRWVVKCGQIRADLVEWHVANFSTEMLIYHGFSSRIAPSIWCVEFGSVQNIVCSNDVTYWYHRTGVNVARWCIHNQVVNLMTNFQPPMDEGWQLGLNNGIMMLSWCYILQTCHGLPTAWIT